MHTETEVIITKAQSALFKEPVSSEKNTYRIAGTDAVINRFNGLYPDNKEEAIRNFVNLSKDT